MANDRPASDTLQRTLQLLRKMQDRLDAVESRNREPIAIVGIGCRFPGGVDTPEAFWSRLQQGHDDVREVPPERWDAAGLYDPDPAAPGKTNTRWGSFIDDVDLFDPAFFGITPREAVSMDPQQRIVLECAWRALEHAGIPAGSLAGSRTGVFLGLCTSDYARLGDGDGQRGSLDTYSGTGGSNGVAAGRLSYTLGLNGPSLVVDTACSSSLVATHLAVNSLRNGESDLAMAGGVNLVLVPDGAITLAKLHMMAPDGRCKAFDASANGFVRGEGCGIVVLQRLSDAQAQGSRILAVIRGSAVNQDGRSSGLTAPNGMAQERVLRDALANAGRAAADVAYVEAHGTGTALGDPIELDALQRVLGPGRDRPVAIGSVKANIGHLEAAAGIAGLIKTVGVVRSRQVPPTLHFTTLNPNVAGGAPGLHVSRSAIALTDDGPLLAGVSSFGFSGTNAHVVIEAPSPSEPSASPQGMPQVLPLSARNPEALDALRTALAENLPEHLADAAYTLAVGRTHFNCRMAVVASGREEAIAALLAATPTMIEPCAVALAVDHDADSGSVAKLLRALGERGIGLDAVVARDQETADRLGEGLTIPCLTPATSRMASLGIGLIVDPGAGAGARQWPFGRPVTIVDPPPSDLPALAAQLYAAGADIDWGRYSAGTRCAIVSLPGHPMDRKAYWRDRGTMRVGAAHPLLGEKIAVTSRHAVFRTTVRDASASHLGQHRAGGKVVASAAALMEAALSAAIQCGWGTELCSIRFDAPLVFNDPRVVVIEIIEDAVTISSESPEQRDLTRHLSARLGAGKEPQPLARMPQATRPVEPAEVYARFQQGGIEYAGDYRRILTALAGPGVAEVRIAGGTRPSHLMDPALLDAVLQSLAVATHGQDGALRIPSSCDRIWLSPRPDDGGLTVRTSVSVDGDDVRADLVALDDSQHVAVHIEGLRLAPSSLLPESKAHLYERRWIDRPLPPTAADSAQEIDAWLRCGIRERGLQRLATLGSQLDELARLHADIAKAVVSADQVRKDQQHLFGLLHRWPAAGSGDTAERVRQLQEGFPESRTEIDLLQRCGVALPGVLRGDVNPLDLIFGEGGEAAIYGEAPLSRLLNDAIAEAVMRLLTRDGPLRILEVGAGTGATTRAVLQRLPHERMALYSFTDVAPSLVARARNEFAGLPWFEASAIDLERSLEDQGLDGHYDIIIAANVLHATSNLDAVLRRLHRRLVPGGALVALEGTGPQGWIDLVFGQTPGWWAFEDAEARGHHAMPDRMRWRDLLERTGYDAGLTQVDEDGLLHRQAIIIGRTSAGRNWIVAADAGPQRDALAASIGAMPQGLDIVLPADLPDGVVVLAPVFETCSSVADWIDGAAEALDRIRRLALILAENNVPLVLVTRGAFDGDMIAAGLWGLGRAISAEYPALRLRTVDIAEGVDWSDALQALADEIGRESAEDQVRITSSGRQVARLFPLHPPADDVAQIDDAGMHVITGGFGGLGLAVADRLATRGARHILLIGRSEPSSGARAVIDGLRARGVGVIDHIADVTDVSAIDRIFAALERPVAGVIHAAGTLVDRPLLAMDKASFAEVIGPKAGGCIALERHLGSHSYFIAFSSAIALVGTGGQSNHIAANAMLDAFVKRRHGQGHAAASLAFGAWRDIGSATSQQVAAGMTRSGLSTIASQTGLAAVEGALAGRLPCETVVIPIDRTRLSASLRGPPPPLFRHLLDKPPPRHALPSPAKASAPLTAGQSSSLGAVLTEIAAVMAAGDVTAVDLRRNLFDQGIDSLMAVELRNRLQKVFDRQLPSTLLFDHPMPLDLAAFLDGAARPRQQAAPAPLPGDDIAIVGMACRFPGGANDTESFWALLKQGYNAVCDWPADRPPAEAGATPGRAAYVDDVALFDAPLFRIAPREAASMDPQQRILLETAWHALEDAGIPAERLAGTPTGVYVGLCNTDYAHIAATAGGINAWSGTGSAPSVTAGRLAYVLGLQGPAMVVDTACSSALVAVHLAARALLDGDCDAALACAANLILTPSTTEALDALNMLAPDGQCKAFDAAADGFGRGEGIGVVVLKRRSQAVADGDSILAVIRAVSVNQDGRSSSLTAPNGMAQSALIRQALDRCRLAPRDIDYVEAHGTGTALGDPIEIHALKDVFAPSRDAGRPLRVGAVKSNVAHLEAAAGMAGLIKTVLALNHGELPPNIHFDRLNPHISTDGFPVVFPQRVEPWPDRNDAPRRAGVSSFGFSGTNAHVILEASPQATSAVVEPPAGPFLLVLSAASEASARRLASLLSDRVVTAGASELRDIACTLIGNRSQLDWRIAVIAQHADDAARRLREAVPVQAETAHRNPFVFTGSMDCERARQHFLSGVPLEMGGDVSYRRARLPLYPFDRKPYWFEASRPKAIQPAPDGEHPLLGRRCRSPGAERRYESTLHPARHPWFADHAVDGRAAMPAAAIIGMFQHAAGDGAVLNDVRFQTLLHVDEPVVLSTVVSDGRITLHSSPLETDDWSLVAEASLARRDHDAPAPNALETGNAGEAVTDLDGYYDLFSRQGLRYGEGFRTIVALHGGPGHARARLALPGGSDHVRGHFVHPALLDGAFQSLAAAAAGLDLAGSGFRPAAVRSVTLRGPAGNEAVSFATVRTGDDGALIADLEIETPDGQPLASIAGLELRPTQRDDEGFATIADVSWERYVPAAGRFPGETVIVHAGSRSIASAVIDVLDALRPLLHDGDPRRIAVATRLAASLPGDIHSPDIAGAAVHGLCASLMQEYPRALIVVIDLDHQDGGVEIELPSESGFYALRNGGIFTRRLVPREAWSGEAVTLRRPEDGRLAELNYAPQRMQQPGPGQVLLSVAVSGLNFRDVMNALGTYPGDAGKLGGEMAGFVLAVGEGVAGLVPGDKVMAIAPGSHASHVVADARLVWPLPRDWSLAQAATAPTVYLTAAALRTMGEIGPDKTILIHAGTGGVGLAAIAIARAAGARIIATAGTEAKRNALRDIGLTSVSDSRSLRFVEDVQQATGGEGVDIVLNSLSGALIAAGFDVLKPGGVFLEMGRAGVWDDATAQAYRPDVRYTRISLDDDIFNAPRKVAETWRELQRDIAAGLLPPLPVKLFPATDAAQAFAYMRDARHIGRIGLNRQLLDSSSAYLVTGGTGALGLAAAARLVELGATQVTLAGRGGRSPDPDRLAKLRHMGADIQVRMVDMTDRTAVEALLQSFDRPLRGIIHAAGVLDDGTAQTLTDHQIRAVLDAKLSSALHLDRASRSHPLDFFVLFSSAAGVLGSAGQANYASANAGLDALAAKRRSDGLPAVSIAWGAWNQGMASKLRGPRLSEAAGLMILERVLQGETPHIIAMPGRARVAGAEAQALADASATLRGRLLAAADAERYGIMRDAIRALVSTDMAIPETELASRRPLHDYGLDSLLAVELRNGLAALASKTMPASLLFDYPTIDALAGFLLERMIEAPPRSPVTGSAPAVTPPTVDSVDAARQLMQELELAGY